MGVKTNSKCYTRIDSIDSYTKGYFMKGKFDVDIEDKRKEVLECQESYDLKGCERCDEFFKCTLRADYVKSVYTEMNKDSLGGFKF